MEKIYIVTGATGFVGCNLVEKLLAKGEKVRAFVRSKEKVEKVFSKLLDNPNLEFFYGDMRNADEIEKMFFDADTKELVVMNTAAVVLIGGNKKLYAEMREVNIKGTQNIIDLCIKYNLKLVHVSSVHAITEPKKRALTHEIENFDQKAVHGPYAKTKAEASRMIMDAIKNKGLNAVMVHPGGITGPGDYGNSHLTELVILYMTGKIPAATAGGYDFVDVRDVCDGIILAEKAEKGNCYLLTNRYYKVRELLDMLYDITGYKKIKSTLPMWVAKVGLPFLILGAKIKKVKPLYTSYSLYTLRSNSNYSHEKATKELGYQPRELYDSLKDTVEFLKETKQI